jgi:REP element-mobilizing transposase RayT
MPRAPQLKLFATKDLGSLEHGGDTRKCLRKTRRPFSPDASIHLVLRSERAHGRRSLLHRRNRSRVEALIHGQAARAGIRVYRHANVGNHLHLLVKAPSRRALSCYLRALSGLIARHVLEARKGKPMLLPKVAPRSTIKPRFWDHAPYSRLVHWGREFRALCASLAKNRLEACGFGGAKLRFKPNGEAVIVVGDPGFRPGDELAGTLLAGHNPSHPRDPSHPRAANHASPNTRLPRAIPRSGRSPRPR